MPSDANGPRGPIFIIGAMGSGTTLLRLMLDSHEHIAIPHETGFMRAYNAMRFIPFKWTGRRWARRMGWSDEELDAEVSAFFDRIFRRYADEHGARRWGEKTPLHAWHITAMQRLFPDAQFVAIVRHPGASTVSNMRRFHHGVRKMTFHWGRYNREITRQVAHFPDRFVLLRYEDLVLDTERVLRELLEWLGEPWSDRVLEHHVVQAEREHQRVEGKSRPDRAVDPSRIHSWVETVKKEDRKVIRRRLGRLAEFYGYSMAEPTRIDPLSDRGAALLTGAEVAARIERFPELDFKTRPPVPLFEQQYNPRKVWLVANKTPGGEPPRSLKHAKPESPPPVPRWRRAVAPIARRLPAGARVRLRRLVGS